MKDIKIRDVKTILTEPDGIQLVIVKILTTEPDLYGVGCATFTQRPNAVFSSIEDYLKPFIIDKNVTDIEDIWHSSYVSSYWRNGPVLNNALSGIDQALWDIKGKMANMPIYDLWGGKSRSSAAVYGHANGNNPDEVEEKVHHYIENGYHHVRIQVATPGYATYSHKSTTTQPNNFNPKLGTDRIFHPKPNIAHAHPGGIFEPKPYIKSAINLFEHIRSKVGWDIEILHDVHERIPPILGIDFAKQVESYKLFFLEDLFSPEDNDYFKIVRNQTSTPIAMGELYNNPHEITPMIKERLIDFIRVHISQIGGLTPAKKLAALCEAFNVRTAWHGPGDTSPVGHAANLMLDLNAINFGIHEYSEFGDNTKEVFPGCPKVLDGYMWHNGKPGLGIDINEELASKFPYTPKAYGGAWDTIRRSDGSVVKP